VLVGASSFPGQLTIADRRDNVNGVVNPPSQRWIYSEPPVVTSLQQVAFTPHRQARGGAVRARAVQQLPRRQL
jgi:hypothetical protein